MEELKKEQDVRKEQIEALDVILSYDVKLAKGIRTILPELRGEEKEDTQEYLKQIVNGLNFTIETINGTKDLLNETKERIDKDKVNVYVNNLGEALKKKSNPDIADVLEKEMLPFVEDLMGFISDVLDEQK